MRTLAIVLTAALAAAATGCAQPPAQDPNAVGILQSKTAGDGLTVTLRAPMRDVAVGDTLPVAIIATNKSDKDIAVKATTGAEAYVAIARNTPIGWEETKRYPEAATMVVNPWVLKAGESRTFTLNLPVTKEWPTNESLRLSAALNGRPDVAPAGNVQVYGSRAECDRAKLYLSK